jgi:DNA-directed RNA polymerase specialized sigma24 family protein
MDDRERGKALRRLEKEHGPELRRAIGGSPACSGRPNDLAMNAFRAYVTQLAAKGESPARPRDTELTVIYDIARGLLGEQYRVRRAGFPEPALAVEELRDRALARIKRNRVELEAALRKLTGEELEAFLLGLPPEYCECRPERCMHRFTHAEIAAVMALPGGKDQAKALWRTARGRLRNDALLARHRR